MAKDRNSAAKRQRESDKKRKADEKRRRRATRQRQPTDSDGSESQLSTSEHAVLEIFRKYLMAPRQVLCLGKHDLETFDVSLAQLTDKGMLVSEKFQGAYSLTEIGFAAMKAGD